MATQDVATYQNGVEISRRTETVTDAFVNGITLRQHVTNAIATFEQADANWATLTAAQRNDVMKQAVRTVARLGRLLNDQLDAT